MNTLALAFALATSVVQARADATAPLLTDAVIARPAAAAWMQTDALRQTAAPPDPWIGPDKVRHLFVAYGATAFTYAWGQAAGMDDDDALLTLAVLAGAGAALGKEIADRLAGHPVSVKDLLWDAVGIAGAWAVLRHAR